MDEFHEALESFRTYLRMHPRVRVIYRSPFFIVALAIAGLSYQRWLAPDWSATPLLVLPALLGFSLAAFILLLTMGSDEYRSFLQNVPSKIKPLSVLQVTFGVFAHFIFIQVLALLAAVIGDAHPFRGKARLLPIQWQSPALLADYHFVADALSFCAYALFILAITTSVAAAFAILTLAKWYSEFLKVTKNIAKVSEDPRPLQKL